MKHTYPRVFLVNVKPFITAVIPALPGGCRPTPAWTQVCALPLQDLYTAGEEKFGTDEEKFITILGNRSSEHLQKGEVWPWHCNIRMLTLGCCPLISKVAQIPRSQQQHSTDPGIIMVKCKTASTSAAPIFPLGQILFTGVAGHRGRWGKFIWGNESIWGHKVS